MTHYIRALLLAAALLASHAAQADTTDAIGNGRYGINACCAGNDVIPSSQQPTLLERLRALLRGGR